MVTTQLYLQTEMMQNFLKFNDVKVQAVEEKLSV